MESWVQRALELFEKNIITTKIETDSMDWKERLSGNNEKLSKHLSAFSNNPGGGFLIYGIKDKNCEIVGLTKTDINTTIEKISSIARDTLNPPIRIHHYIHTYTQKDILFIFIPESDSKPVYLKNSGIEDSYIRSSCTTRKASHQELGLLMINNKTTTFEEAYATKLITQGEVLQLLDYEGIRQLLNMNTTQNTDEVIRWLEEIKMIKQYSENGFYITNFGALAAAHDLNNFANLFRKTIRLIKYKGNSKYETEKEFPGKKGYAIGFEGLITFIINFLPQSEIIKKALRQNKPVYPEIALRELIANALIHQDFTIKGKGPLIEIFDDRVDISNPGRLLPSKTIDRLIGTSPESRNEILASAFRQYGICEERGSGFIKTILDIEFYGLPPLKFEEGENYFKVTMYAPKKYAAMTKAEKISACYQHAIIKYLNSEALTNTSLRERLRVSDRNISMISRLINEAVQAGKIKPKDPNNKSSKFTEYIPYWA